MNSTVKTTEDTHQVAWAINLRRRTGNHGPKAFVQSCGTLRVAAASCADARVAISRAAHDLGVRESNLTFELFEVRFSGTQDVLAYPLHFDPARAGIDAQTGALVGYVPA